MPVFLNNVVEEPAASKVHRSAEELVKHGPNVAWFKTYTDDGCLHFISGAYLYHPCLYPQLMSDEWIEVVW